MSTYKLTHEGYVIRDGNTKVPIADTPEFPNTNPDYLAYKAWLAAGGVPSPADMVQQQVPQEVPRWAGKLALKRHALQNGEVVLLPPDAVAGSLLDSVHTWWGTLGLGEAYDRVEAAMSDAKDWRRDSPTVATIASVLGLTESQIDGLFVWAGAQEL